ncbi:MAG TPA: GDSL-type esterase/lipase family protein [Opitutaceae bacterium]|nr:GDSL-type esterase/lipase family protein [Opitutaceae bacterium]
MFIHTPKNYISATAVLTTAPNPSPSGARFFSFLTWVRTAIVCAAGLPLSSVARADLTPPATVITDSGTDFSGAQGKSGWHYGDFYGTDRTFQSLIYNGTGWTGPYDALAITSGSQHPSSTDGIVQVSAVRRWVSYYDGTVSMVGSFQIGHNGDGVGVQLVVDGSPVIARTTIGNSGSAYSVSFNFNQIVHVGTVIDFIVDPGPARDYSADDTSVTVVISTLAGEPLPPAPPAGTAPPPPSNTVLADSVQDFSLTDGYNGWSYGDFYGDRMTLEPVHSNGTAWVGNYDGLLINAQTQHPSATDQIVQVSAVRRWTSSYNGSVHIVGKFQIDHNGDGVGVRVLIDCQPVVSRIIIGNSGTTQIQSFDLIQTVHVGSQIDFAVDPGPGRDYNADNAQCVATISTNGSSASSTTMNNVAAWGDSLTQGTGGTPYPTQLGNLTFHAVYNGGIYGETSTQIKNRMLAATDKYVCTTIIWAGRNNYADPATVKADIAAMVSALGHTKYLVVGVINGNYSGEYSGQSGYATLVQLNTDLAAAYGSHFVDIRTCLVSHYDPNNPQDVADHAKDIPPTSLRSDPIHLNTAGYSVVANNLYSCLGSL